MATTSWRDWLVDTVVGGAVGAVVGGVVAVNLVIFSGLDRGYESGLRDIFDRSILLGLVVMAVLVAGPVLGLLVARKQRAKRANTERHSH